MRFTLATFVCVFSLFAQAQSDMPTDKEQTDREIERIEVTGKKPKSFYKREYKRLHKDFVAAFNNKIENSEYEIVCKMESQTGSRRKQRLCQPRFFETLISQETQKNLSIERDFTRASNAHMNERVQEEILEEYKKFMAFTEELLKQDPELADKYSAMNVALQKSQ